jgi:hypothetical protein
MLLTGPYIQAAFDGQTGDGTDPSNGGTTPSSTTGTSATTFNPAANSFPGITNIGGGSFPGSAILPGLLPALYPGLQSGWGQFLTSNVGKGVPGYTGSLSPNVSDTVLPKVSSSWQPWDAGTSYLADLLGNNKLGIGKTDPNLANTMQWGGTGGVGNNAMSMMMQYGTPSQAGQYLANMAQFGASSPGIANLLSNQAQGFPVGAAQYLIPFLMDQGGGNRYQAPMIPNRQLTIGGR